MNKIKHNLFLYRKQIVINYKYISEIYMRKVFKGVEKDNKKLL